jgi:hypothetical protein
MKQASHDAGREMVWNIGPVNECEYKIARRILMEKFLG